MIKIKGEGTQELRFIFPFMRKAAIPIASMLHFFMGTIPGIQEQGCNLHFLFGNKLLAEAIST